ncbi:deoxynucleoside triphosphate triphosphohydrolase SAMHD1-like [Symphorus nematophorus]
MNLPKSQLKKDCYFNCFLFYPEHNITGKRLRSLTVDDLRGMDIEQLNDREKILLHISKLWQVQGKVFNDPIHGHVELHPLLIKIIDTPEFQRLRYIKQLGGVYFVYPGASHNRFEHSIGVAHLAGQLAEALRTSQPYLHITDRDILCVQIAGLCHDLGHGPFSHLFDGMFIPKACQGSTWKHEMASCDIFDRLVNKLRPVMEKHGLKLPEDQVFIKEMIAGPPDSSMAQAQEWPYEGRKKDKSFLYEIVANKRTGIDVDKFDYFARDCHHLGIQNNFDHCRFLKFARVCEVDGLKHICIRDKEEDNMTEMFHTRYCLHKRAYQHKVNKIIETMIKDAFLKADNHIQIEGSGGRMFTLSTAKDDMEAYIKLTDHVFEQILNTSSTGQDDERDRDLEDARDILNRIRSRDLYRFLGETRHPIDDTSACKRELAQELVGLQPEDFEVMVITMDYGMGEEDPIDNMYFYSKNDYTKAFKRKPCQVSGIRPTCFSERLTRFYYKNTEGRDLVDDKARFEQWCRNKGFPEYQDE